MAGQAYTRTYTFVRTSGGGGTTTYNVSWVGNDGTFAAPRRMALPLNTAGQLHGEHQPGERRRPLGDPEPGRSSTAGIDYQTMNTVIAAEQFTAAGNYTRRRRAAASGATRSLHYFFTVPAGTPAFKVDFSGPSATPGTGQARFLRFHPYGVGIDSNASTSCYYAACRRRALGTPPAARSINPLAGVWEVTVDARRTSDAASVPFTLTASILGASRVAEPRRHRVGHTGRAGRTARTRSPTCSARSPAGRSARRWAARAAAPFSIAQSGSSSSTSVTVTPGRHQPARDDRRHHPTRQPTSTCSCSTAPAAAACWPDRAPTATRRSR